MQAIKENRISVEDVELSLEELDKYIESQNQVNEVLGILLMLIALLWNWYLLTTIKLLFVDRGFNLSILLIKETTYSMPLIIY